jgi:Ni,Fe-hydrogenase III large subunit/Ni,Fe-hydrogenase III component G
MDLTVRLQRPSDVTAAVAELCAEGMALATLVATDETERAERDFKVHYLFEPASQRMQPLPDVFVTLVASLDPTNPLLPSIAAEVPAANWHEREAQDLFGIQFSGHPDPRPLVIHDGWPKGKYPLRKSFSAAQRLPVEPAEEFPHLLVEGEGVMEIPVGPIHAGIIEPGHFRFSSMGETVLHLDARLFYTHRGLEKRIEGMSVLDGFFVAERMCGVCSVAHGLGFCEAVERIAGIEVPPRAKILRTLALELERLYNHVGDIGNISAGASYHYGTSAGSRMKEALQQVAEGFTGNRFLRGLLVPGGVCRDLLPRVSHAIETVVTATAESLSNLMDRIDNNPTVTDRLDTTGVLQREDAMALAVTGVSARASGVNRDARRDHPHAAYAMSDGLQVAVAIETDGDVHARLNLRTSEARESMRLIRALLSMLKPGQLHVPLPANLPPWKIGLSTIESPRGAAIHWLRCDETGKIDRYHLRSASYANWPAVPLAAVSAIVADFPLVNKSFELCYSCTDR